MAPTSVAIPLDQWYEAPFYLTDKERLEVMSGTIPMQASEAIKAVVNQIDGHIIGNYTKVYGVAGVAGATPFATDVSEYTDARKVLAQQLAEMDPRSVVLDPDAEGNALGLRAFQDASFGGGDSVIMNGQIGRKMGAQWAMSQNIVTHTAGTASGTLVNNVAGYAIGTSSGILTDTGTGTLVVGDIIAFAGHSQTYAVQVAVGDVSSGSLTIEPPLVAAIADNEAITLTASHVVNLAFHRDAFSLAMRPLQMDREGSIAMDQIVDPVSGLALRLEVTRQHKQTRWSFDALWGSQLTRPQFATRILG